MGIQSSINQLIGTTAAVTQLSPGLRQKQAINAEAAKAGKDAKRYTKAREQLTEEYNKTAGSQGWGEGAREAASTLQQYTDLENKAVEALDKQAQLKPTTKNIRAMIDAHNEAKRPDVSDVSRGIDTQTVTRQQANDMMAQRGANQIQQNIDRQQLMDFLRDMSIKDRQGVLKEVQHVQAQDKREAKAGGKK